MTLSPAFLDELRARTVLSAVIAPSVKLIRAGPRVEGLLPVPQRKDAELHGQRRQGLLPLLRLRGARRRDPLPDRQPRHAVHGRGERSGGQGRARRPRTRSPGPGTRGAGLDPHRRHGRSRQMVCRAVARHRRRRRPRISETPRHRPGDGRALRHRPRSRRPQRSQACARKARRGQARRNRHARSSPRKQARTATTASAGA